jgi:hypothetical protein
MNRDQLRDLHWTFPPLAAFLGALGGWSFKWLRRYALPMMGGLLAMAYGIERRRCVSYAVATTMAFSLPYSPDRQPWAVIAVVGAFYGATPLILSFRWRRLWWPVLTAAILVGLLTLSATVDWWTHKWTETVVFGLHGFLVAYTIDRRKSEESNARA